MAAYYVQNTARPNPIERLEAPSSFAARTTYAERHGCDVTDVIARRADLVDGTWRALSPRNPEA
jgi:hypothetical protein